MAKKRPTARKLAADERVPIPAHLRPRPAIDYELDKKPEHRVRSALRGLTPGLNYLTRKYSGGGFAWTASRGWPSRHT